MVFILAKNSNLILCRMFPLNQENKIVKVETLLNKMTVQRRGGYSEEEIRCRCREEEDTQKRRLLRNCLSSLNHPSNCLGPSATFKNRTPRSCICLFLAPTGARGMMRMRAYLEYSRPHRSRYQVHVRLISYLNAFEGSFVLNGEL